MSLSSPCGHTRLIKKNNLNILKHIPCIVNIEPKKTGILNRQNNVCGAWHWAWLIDFKTSPIMPPSIFRGGRRWEASTLEKLFGTSTYISAHNQGRMLATWLPPEHVLHEHTWTHMNCTRMWAKWHFQGFSKESASCQDIITCKSTYSLSNRTDQVRGHHYEESWPRSSPS